jgi:hypothetical protein
MTIKFIKNHTLPPTEQVDSELGFYFVLMKAPRECAPGITMSRAQVKAFKYLSETIIFKLNSEVNQTCLHQFTLKLYGIILSADMWQLKGSDGNIFICSLYSIARLLLFQWKTAKTLL